VDTLDTVLVRSVHDIGVVSARSCRLVDARCLWLADNQLTWLRCLSFLLHVYNRTSSTVFIQYPLPVSICAAPIWVLSKNARPHSSRVLKITPDT